MHPILLKLGPFTLYSYGLALALAFLLAVGLASHVTKRALRGSLPLSQAALIDWGTWVLLGGIVGGRLLYVVLHWQAYVATPWEILALWHGGLVWYGGFFGGLVASWWYCRSRGYPFLRSADQVIPFVALGHAVGRIGCFANGCCYGTPTSSWCGVQFPGHPAPVVPVQLFESASLILLYIVLRALQHPPLLQRPGRLLGVYSIGYALIRWTLEFWRGDQPIVWAGFTLHQLISLGIFVTGLGLIFKAQGSVTGEQSAVSSQQSEKSRHG